MRLKSTLKKVLPRKSLPSVHLAYSHLSYLGHQLVSPFYYGNQFTCPICNKSFRKFLAYGASKPRANAKCPGCGSVERHRLLWLYLKNKTNFFVDQLKVLDIAPVLSLQKRWLKLKNLDYLSGDISSPLAMVKMDITNIKLPDNQFDVIICYHVLEHILDDKKAMSELLRVLKPGGWAILQSAVDYHRSQTLEDPSASTPGRKEELFGLEDHFRTYGRDYQNRLESIGFTVKPNHYPEELGEDQIKRYGLIRDDIIYFCTKPNP